MSARPTPDRIDTAHAALIVYDACRRALTPTDLSVATGTPSLTSV